jgi:hypothetical protein
MYDRLALGRELMSDDGVIFSSIDDNEIANLRKLFDSIFSEENYVTEFIWEKKKKPSFLHKNIGKLSEYIPCYIKNSNNTFPFSIETTTEGKKYPLNNAVNSINQLIFPPKTIKFNMPDCIIEPQDMSEGNIITKLLTQLIVKDNLNENEFVLEGEWRYSQTKVNEIIANNETIVISKIPFRPNHIKTGGEVKKMKNNFSPTHYQMETNEDATEQVISLFGNETFNTPKPIKLLQTLIQATTYVNKNDLVLDYFAGSGTTGHAVINLNREDKGTRKYILVEMGEYFDTVTKPRIQKVIYSDSWKNGKPTTKNGISQIFKYSKLESYEDTLNNLKFERTAEQENTLNNIQAQTTEYQDDTLGFYNKFKEDYILNYSLDIESQGSLLNIDTFKSPFDYKLQIATSSVGETKNTSIDLVETFNYLLGLIVKKITPLADYLVIEGQNLKGDKILIIWRNGQSNDELNKFFVTNGQIFDTDFNTIYVNGDNNLDNLKTDDDNYSVKLIEQEFKKLMFGV